MTQQQDWIDNSALGLWSLNFEDRNIPWQSFAPGVDIFPLCKTEDGSVKAALMRNAPGAEVPEHVHQGYEFILLLAGSESDARATYRAGDFIANPPGSSHRLWSDEGNTVLIIWEASVQFV